MQIQIYKNENVDTDIESKYGQRYEYRYRQRYIQVNQDGLLGLKGPY